ncbi:hypothetical protein HJA76_15105 [Rhizobium bangladeshense]|uniref:hypothetical protein n=1 Tax=Rhizobium bangladeshense TaxID=1138189 RepID=UPI001C83DC54|nr:hypothetical protein [Rhizobium bangladeshense]MBX4921019.1 hypothetical protein [Rhizobium bangladeshense]
MEKLSVAIAVLALFVSLGALWQAIRAQNMNASLATRQTKALARRVVQQARSAQNLIEALRGDVSASMDLNSLHVNLMGDDYVELERELPRSDLSAKEVASEIDRLGWRLRHDTESGLSTANGVLARAEQYLKQVKQQAEELLDSLP